MNLYNRKEFSVFFYTRKGLVLTYFAILSFALINRFFLVVSVLLSSFLLIFWLVKHPNLANKSIKSLNLFFLGLLLYILGAPFFADPTRINFLKIGTAFFFFSRIFFFLYFYFHLRFVNYFSLKYVLFLIPFLISLVYSHYFLSQVIPDEVFIFVIPLTFIDTLLVASIPAFVHQGGLKKLYISTVLFMALLDHVGGYFIYTSTSESLVLSIRVMSALLKLFLVFLVFEIAMIQK